MANGSVLRIKKEAWDKSKYVEFDERDVVSGAQTAVIRFPANATVKHITDGEIIILMPIKK